MMKRHVLTTALVLFAASHALADGGDAKDLVKKMLDNASKASFSARSTLTSNRGWSREMTMNQKRIADAMAVYIEVTAPHDVSGTRFLMKEKIAGPDEQYIYIPAVKRAIKIAEEARKQQFLGSDFYVSDLVTPDIEAFDYSFVGEETVEGRKTKLVQAVPKSPEQEVYGKSVLAIDPVDLLPVRTQFFDKKGNLFKVLTVKAWEKKGTTWVPMQQEMVDVQGSTSSTIVVTDVNLDVELPDSMFDRTFLLQERGT